MPVRSQPPGLQAERTRLAWRRTTLGTVSVTLLGVSRVATGGLRPVALTALALIGLAVLAVLLLAHRRVRTLGATGLERAGGPDSSPGVLALLVAAIALIGIMLVG